MDVNRRRLLQTSGIVLATGLAGCGGDGGDDGETTDDGDTSGGPDGSTETMDSGDSDTPGTDPVGETEGGTETPVETTESDTSEPTIVEVTIDNVGASAWEVVSGPIAATGVENPTMTFQDEVRYVVTNGGWPSHPFELRTSDDSTLLSQDEFGAYNNDTYVDWRDDGDEFAFTVTRGLGPQMDYYTCTVHDAMRGDATAE